MLRLFLSVLLSVFLTIASLPISAHGAPVHTKGIPLAGEFALPSGWSARNLVDKRLTGSPENPGRWQSFELRAPTGDAVTLHILSETGPGPLFIPDIKKISLDGTMGMGASYQVVREESFRAICEAHPYLGKSVTTFLAGNGTLLVESKTLSMEALLGLCRFLATPREPDTDQCEPILVIP